MNDRIRIQTATEMAQELKQALRSLWDAKSKLAHCSSVLNHCSIEPDKNAGSIGTEFGISDMDAKEFYVLVTTANESLLNNEQLTALMERVG